MARPICWHCGAQLQYVKVQGKDKRVPVFVLHVDPLGHEHKVHVLCAEIHGYKGEKQYG